MKKLIILAVAAFLTLSCGGEDDTTIVGASVEGTWDLTAFDINEAFDLNGDGTSSQSLISEAGCYQNSSLEFHSDNTVTINIEELDINMELVIGTEDTYEYTVDCIEATSETGTYAVIGNNITITVQGEIDGEMQTETILLIRDGNTMTLTVPEMVNVPVDENGEVTYSFVGATIEFTKQ